MKKIICKILTLLAVFSGVFVLSAAFPAEAAAKLSKTEAALDVGENVKLKVKGTSKKVTWSSSDAAIARVSKKGTVYALSEGTCTITAKVGKKSLECKVTVTDSATKTLDSSVTIGNIKIPISSKWEKVDVVSTDKVYQYIIDKTVYKGISIQITPLSEKDCSEYNSSKENFETACKIVVESFKKEFESSDVKYEIIGNGKGFIGKISAPCKINGTGVSATIYLKMSSKELIHIMALEIGDATSVTDRIVRKMCTEAK
jgi:hypothetical protein